MENTLDVREQFLADARRHKGNDMTQALRDALDRVGAVTREYQRRIAAQSRGGLHPDVIYEIGTSDGTLELRVSDLAALLARLTSDGDGRWIDHNGAIWQDRAAAARFFKDEPYTLQPLPAAPAQPSEGEPR